MTETNRIEYKRELSDGLEKEVIAFLNYREGGIIYIGIDKEGNIYGLPDADGDQLKIKDRLKNNIRPSALGLFDIVSEEREGKNILKIIVASGPEKPYYLKKYGMSEKGCFIRLGSAAEPMAQKMIDELFAKRTRNSISKIKASRQDLSFSQLKIYYEESGHTLGKAFAKNLELLTEEGAFNYAGYLLADKNNTSIKVAKYSGKTRTDLIESNEYGHECLVKATKQVIDKIAVENRTNTKITAKERQQANLWNPIALREAIINAFVHNDYTNEITPKFEIFTDRIEITSAGSLPEGLSEQEFFEGFSVPRNKELMRIFKDLELVEQLGSGIPRILEHYGKESFKFSDNFLRMTFTAKETAVEDGGQIGGVMGGLKGGQKDAEIDDIKELTHRQKEVLKLIASDNRISRSGIAEILHINESAIQKHLNNLKDAGFIERVGGTRGYWEVKLSK
ncbi:putative HTH transcriptional regulator [Gillisia sp. Hel_I_86]|uniref:RNA-binding domain-containing protein n=1 Tax=Gillisia sp. Hel_I_86 TaxID=1249981 RepID=UPI00119A153A|nr:RNA-binding domain-containing protein [Gillisia sp. Hel_I_86]TVZ26093.1 putative HTH transcriptional regulator [Gillisia sp. Hel_I_86]